MSASGKLSLGIYFSASTDGNCRAAKKYSRKGIINAHQLLQKEMYVSCMTFSFFPEPETGIMGVVW
jgi:hypothetical protein